MTTDDKLPTGSERETPWWWGQFNDAPEIIAMCERWGYGRVMQVASEAWAQKDPIGAFVVGTARGLLPCETCGMGAPGEREAVLNGSATPTTVASESPGAALSVKREPDVESIARQAFRAGWWRRSKESALGVSVERRNMLEDSDIPGLVRRYLPTSPPEASEEPRWDASVEQIHRELAGERPVPSEDEAWADLAANARKSWTAENPYETGNDPVPPVESSMTQEMRAAVGSEWAPNQATGTGFMEPEGDER